MPEKSREGMQNCVQGKAQSCLVNGPRIDGFEVDIIQEDQHRQRYGVLQKHRVYQASIAAAPAQCQELTRRCLFEEKRQHEPD